MTIRALKLNIDLFQLVRNKCQLYFPYYRPANNYSFLKGHNVRLVLVGQSKNEVGLNQGHSKRL